jgi:hypothetical protein
MTPRHLFAALVISLLGLVGCSLPEKRTRTTYVARANITEVISHGDTDKTLVFVVWHVGPRGGHILPSTRIRLRMKNYRELFKANSEPMVGATYNLLIDQKESQGVLHFSNVRFAPRGSQETIPLASPPYAKEGHEIRIDQ